jgi:hypothetical protein
MTRPTTPAQRARLVAQWQASSLSQAASARRHHIHPRTFWDWVREVPTVAPAQAAKNLSMRWMDRRAENGIAPGG